jgi:hypothetical protein
MRRALRWDGVLPGAASPDEIQTMKAWIAEHRSIAIPFDIVVEGRTPGDDPMQAAAIVRPYTEAGVTWWIEAMWTRPNEIEDVRARLALGPPKGHELNALTGLKR